MHAGILIGIAFIGAAFWLMRRELGRIRDEEKRRSRSPFKEKLLSPAGESLRLKIEGLRERMLEEAMILSAFATLAGIAIMGISTRNWIFNVTAWVLLGGIGFVLCRKQWRKLRDLRNDLRNYRLGFDGERYVAEKLSVLTRLGYRVFHDFFFDMKPGGEATNFNIDHIVVGPAGVFVIETKACRQPNGELPDGEKSHKVSADGDALRFPGGHRRRKPLDQARRNAEDLSKWLTGSAPRKVTVFPIVAMPGWYTEEDGFPDLLVLNPTRIAVRVPRMRIGGGLQPHEVQIIGDRIEAHCRNVEGA